MTSAADISALIASTKPTTGRDGCGQHFARAELRLISGYRSEHAEGPADLFVEIRSSRDCLGVCTAGYFYMRRFDGQFIPFLAEAGSAGPQQFRLSHEAKRLTEKEVVKLHARTLTDPKFQAWLAQSLEHFRAGGKL